MNEKSNNVLILKGNRDTLQKFNEDFSGQHIGYFRSVNGSLVKEVYAGYSLDNFIPRNKSVYESDNLSWEMKHWGCCSDLEDVNLCITKDYYTYSFVAGEFAPKKAIEEISKIYPDLEFKLMYVELGGLYAGDIKYKDGAKTILSSIGPDRTAVQKFIKEREFD